MDNEKDENAMASPSSDEIDSGAAAAGKKSGRPWKKVITWTAVAAAACGIVASQTLYWAHPRANTNTADDTSKTEQSPAANSAYALDHAKVASSKTETVHVDADASGTPRKTMVTSRLSNDKHHHYLTDTTSLSDIGDVDGADDWSKDGDTLTWAGADNNVSYTGTTNKQAPIGVKVTYKLNGQPISPKALKGKSGHVTMRFDYENKTRSTTTVDGQQVSTVTPFVCATVFQLDNDKFSHVKVTNGRVMDAVGRTVAAGYALPGVAESLGLKSTPKLPDHFEVSADVKNFSIDSTATYATSSTFGNINEKKLDTSSVDKQMDTLQTSMNALVKGGDNLSAGLAKLAAGGNTAADGSARLAKGAAALAAGTDKLNTSVSALPAGTKKLNDGANNLSDGLGTLSSGIGSLSNGAGNLSDGAHSLSNGIGSLSDGIDSLDNGIATLDKSVSALPDATKKLNNGTSSLAKSIGSPKDTADDRTLQGVANTADAGAAQLEAGLKQLNDQGSSLADMSSQMKQLYAALDKMPSADSIAEVQDSVATAAKDSSDAVAALKNIDTSKLSGADAAKVKQALEKTEASDAANKKAYDTLQKADLVNVAEQANTLKQMIGKMSSQSGSGSSGGGAADGITRLYKGAKDLHTATTALATNLQKAGQGAKSLADGTGKLNTSADKLVAGIEKLASGSGKLASGADKLSTGSDSLVSGADKLASGADKLDAGGKNAAEGAQSLADGTGTLAGSAEKLATGVGSLNNGAQSLNTGVASLTGGITKLDTGLDSAYSGSEKLDSGLHQFDKKAIEKMVNGMGGNLDSGSRHMKAMVRKAKAFDTFTGKDPHTKGSVTFVIKTDNIG